MNKDAEKVVNLLTIVHQENMCILDAILRVGNVPQNKIDKTIEKINKEYEKELLKEGDSNDT